jgi:hypothetical protein
MGANDIPLHAKSETPTTSRFVTLGLVTALSLGLPGCGNDPDKAPQTSGRCTATPPKKDVGWNPASSVPVPDAGYWAGDRPAAGKQQRAVMVFPGDLASFMTFAKEKWPAAGFEILPGETDKDDAEFGFKKDGASGAISLAQHNCKNIWTEVLLIYGN